MEEKLRSLISDYLEEAQLMQVCTVAGGNPWACSVWQAADEDLNTYFFSSITRRHSKELESDSRVAGALALPQTPADPPRGLQFEGTAQMLTEASEIEKARNLYENRIFDGETIDTFINHSERPHRFYRITPKRFVLFDVVNFPEDPRKEYLP